MDCENCIACWFSNKLVEDGLQRRNGSPHAKLNQRLGGSEDQVHQQFGIWEDTILDLQVWSLPSISLIYIILRSHATGYRHCRGSSRQLEAARGVFEAPQEIFDFLLEKKVLPSTLPRMITFIPFTSMNEVLHT
jgi:hypothetical protein